MNRFCIIAACVVILSGCSTPTPQTITATSVSFTSTAVATSTMTATPSATSTLTHTPTMIPSATPTATSTSTPTATPTLTSTPAPTKTRVATPTPTPAPRYPGIALREPPDNQKRETVAITFQWEPLDLNRDGDRYQVCVRRATSPTCDKTFDAGRDRKAIWGREQNGGIGYGDFVWTVSVIDALNNIVSDKGIERKFYWCHPRSGCQECSSCHR